MRAWAFALLTLARVGRASADDDPAALLTHGADALARGATREAIESYEAYADRGGIDPDVSYSRGVAYLARVRAADDKPGDLGRAAAAFEEALAQRPDDADAARALDAVRAEVAHRRARGGNPIEVDAGHGALRSLVGLIPSHAWELLSVGASALLTAALLARRTRPGAVRFAGGVGIAVATPLLAIAAAAAGYAHHVRSSETGAVVITPELRLLDAQGAPTPAPVVPEAARVDVLEHRGALAHVRWGRDEGWAQSTNLFELPGTGAGP